MVQDHNAKMKHHAPPSTDTPHEALTKGGQFDWENLRHFGVLASTLNLARAARQLQCSEATVMRRVRGLEAALGTALFVRRRDGHLLTDAGLRLQAAATDTQALLQTTTQALRGQDREARGRVRITTTEVVAQWILLPRLAEFARAWPALTLAIDASPNAMDLTQDDETIAVRLQRPTRGPYVIRRLGNIRFALFASKAWLGVGRSNKAVPWMPKAPYVGWTAAFSGIALARWLRSHFSPHQPVVELSSMHAQWDACLAGVGVCALPEFLAHPDPRLIRVNAPQDPDTFSLDAWLVIPKAMRQAARVRAVVKMIETAFEAPPLR
jgi:DNA-binding transcriptional LysR family regulator